MTRRLAAPLLALTLLAPWGLGAGEKEAVVYKHPLCGCCTGYAQFLREQGYKVTEEKIEDMASVKKKFGVPDNLQSCHTALIDGYVIEGHVPKEALDKLLKERPAVIGLASPGMPSGTPGMPGPHEPNLLHTFSPKGTQFFGEY